MINYFKLNNNNNTIYKIENGEKFCPISDFVKDSRGNVSLQETLLKNSFHGIRECDEKDCIYSRDKSCLRDKFEKKIYDFCLKKDKLVLMFYASFMLFQELNILLKIGGNVSEVHLIDFCYDNFNTNPDNDYNIIFQEFTQVTRKINPNIKIYVHVQPLDLINNLTYTRKVDLLAGIDIDYSIQFNNKHIMLEIAKNILKLDGRLILSQNFTEKVKISEYVFDIKANLVLFSQEKYLRKKYFSTTISNLSKLLYVPTCIGGIISSIIIFKNHPYLAIFLGGYSTINLFARFNFDREATNKKIYTISKILRT